MTAIDVNTGNVAWHDRSFGKVNIVLADGKVILLDEGGDLARVTLSPEGMQVRWRVPLAAKQCLDCAYGGGNETLRARPADDDRPGSAVES